MSRKFLVAIDLAKNELQNGVVHNLAGAPGSPAKGQLYMNTTDNTMYWWDGTTWQSAKGGASSFPGYGSVPAETTFGLARSDGVATTTARSDHTHGSPVHDAAAHATIPLSALAVPTSDISLGGFKITQLADPTAFNQAATKQYVDGLVNGLSWKEAVRAATTGNIALTGLLTIDGVVTTTNDRVLVKNQSSGAQNGIYAASAGAWTRTGDADTANDLEGASVFVMEGTTLGDTSWVCTTDGPITPGTTPTTWAQFAGPGAVTAGTGMTQSGNTLNVIGGTGITVAADSVAVDPAYFNTWYARKVAANCLAATTTTVTHNFGLRTVGVEVFRNSTPWDTVDVDVERPDTNSVTVRFAVAPAAAEYTIAVFG